MKFVPLAFKVICYGGLLCLWLPPSHGQLWSLLLLTTSPPFLPSSILIFSCVIYSASLWTVFWVIYVDVNVI